MRAAKSASIEPIAQIAVFVRLFLVPFRDQIRNSLTLVRFKPLMIPIRIKPTANFRNGLILVGDGDMRPNYRFDQLVSRQTI